MQKMIRQFCACLNQVLAIIQDQQQAFGAQIIRNDIEDGHVWHLTQSKYPRDSWRDERNLGERRQFCHPGPIREGWQKLLPNLQCEPGLACSARTCQREQARVREQLLYFNQLALTPDEAGQLKRQVMWK